MNCIEAGFESCGHQKEEQACEVAGFESCARKKKIMKTRESV